MLGTEDQNVGRRVLLSLSVKKKKRSPQTKHLLQVSQWGTRVPTSDLQVSTLRSVCITS